MIEIRLIQPDEWEDAKRVVYRVAHEIFNDQRVLEYSIAYYESRHELADMDNIQRNYFENGGTFLVMFQDGEMICTGAIRRLEDDTCELKRLWLLPGYHGQGLGYRMLQELLSFAKNTGYKRVWLQTDPEAQSRAVNFYKQIGFHEIPRYTDQTDDICMKIIL
ncbi:MAG: GNAT family N-acetyltransferase [Chloroflexota bacterium]